MLSWVPCLVGLTGCLLPPPVDEIPAHTNGAPSVLFQDLHPTPVDGPLTLSTKCNSYLFQGFATDPDTNDTLYYRVFLDYQLNPRPETVDVATLAPVAGTASRDFRFHVSPNDQNFRADNPHTVEMWLSDRAFLTDETAPRGLAAADPDALFDSVSWTVQLTNVVDDQCTDPL